MARWVGFLPGGLAVASIFSCAIFAAVSGSSVATTFAIGAILIPALIRHGYPTTYAAALQAIAALRVPVDAFFDAVMVNVDDPALRTNRLALLGELHGVMNRVADLSRLAAGGATLPQS